MPLHQKQICPTVFYLLGPSVEYSVIWFTIYSVFRIRSNGSNGSNARCKSAQIRLRRLVKQRNHLGSPTDLNQLSVLNMHVKNPLIKCYRVILSSFNISIHFTQGFYNRDNNNLGIFWKNFWFQLATLITTNVFDILGVLVPQELDLVCCQYCVLHKIQSPFQIAPEFIDTCDPRLNTMGI